MLAEFLTRKVLLVAGLTMFLTSASANSQDPQGTGEGPQIQFSYGPTDGDLSYYARFKVPTGFMFAGKGEASKVVELTQNLPSGKEVGVLAPEEGTWFAIFEFDDVGYVKDDEKTELNADEILESLREGTENSNKERVKRGWETLTIKGWVQAPKYEESTNNLEWAMTVVGGSGNESVNYNTRRLGRDGVMIITVVADPDSLQNVIPVFKEIMTTMEFKAGHMYSEFREGDKLADYGLKALIIGGGAAVAAKAGFFKWIWKLLVVVVAGGAAALKKFFGGRKNSTPDLGGNQTSG